MGSEVVNRYRDNIFYGDSVGRDLNVTNIVIQEDSEREFVVTHNANIKPVAYFTGREKELEDLRQRIEEKRKSILVSGMGGIGKTHICRKLFEEYLNRYAEDGNGPFRHIGYIEYDGNMDTSLQRCLKYKEQDSPKKNREASWRELERLASDGKLLLFVDNVDKNTKEDPSLQRLNSIQGAILLTSRQDSIIDEFESYRIGFLSIDHCRVLYERIRFKDSKGNVKPEEVQDLEYVIEKLAGRHTITVELLAHLARTKLWTAKRLREELKEKGFQLQFRKNGELINIQKSYEVLYDLTKLTGAEQNILEAFSMFPYIPLAAETCNEWLLGDAGVNEDDDILNGLYYKGWLQVDEEQKTYSLHPVFAKFINEKTKPHVEMHSVLMYECQKCIQIPKSGSSLECQQFIPFAESMIEKLDVGTNSEYVSFIFDTAYLLDYVAEYKKAEKLYEKSIQIKEKILGGEHLLITADYNNLAEVYRSQGQNQKAEELYEKCLRICERELGEGHLETAVYYNNLAGVYEIRGEYSKAEELYKKSLQIVEREFGENHSKIGIVYNNLAEIYRKQGEYIKAEKNYIKSLRISRKVLGEENLNVARVYANLALVYANQKEYKKAIELSKKSLQIKEKILGEEHLDNAIIYNNLAVMYDDQGEYRKAEELYKKSLRIYERVLGEEDSSTITGYNNLALVYERQGEYEKAITYFFKAYMIFMFKFGLKHPNTQIVYENMEYAFKKWNLKGDFEQRIEEKMEEEE